MINSMLIFKYIWMLIIAVLGAIVGFITKINPAITNKSLKIKIKYIFISIITSMFIAYLSYEIAFYVLENNRLSIAIAGLAAFTGTDLIVLFQKKLFETIDIFFNKLIKKG